MQPTTNAKWSLNRRDNNFLTTLEDADSTQFYWWLDKSGGKGSSLDFKTFRCSTPSSVGSHERKSRFESNLLFLSWLPTDDGVEHRNVLKSKLLPLPPDLSLNRRDKNSLTTLEDADSTQFYWWLDKSGGKGSSLDFKTFRCSTPSSVGSHERKSRFVKPTFPFMATDWRWCWTPKRLEVQTTTFTTGFV